jgi:glutaredoxin
MKLKDYMDAHDIGYELRDIREHPEFADEVRENTGKLGVPFLVIDGEWVRGYQLGQAFTEDFAATLFS